MPRVNIKATVVGLEPSSISTVHDSDGPVWFIGITPNIDLAFPYGDGAHLEGYGQSGLEASIEALRKLANDCETVARALELGDLAGLGEPGELAHDLEDAEGAK